MMWKKPPIKTYFFVWNKNLKVYRVAALSIFSYLQTLPGTPSMPHECLNKTISGFCSFPHRAQLSFYCAGYIHFVIFLPVCLLLVNIKYLLLLYSFNKPSTPISQLFPCTRPFGLFPFTGKEGPFRDLFSDDLSSSVHFLAVLLVSSK